MLQKNVVETISEIERNLASKAQLRCKIHLAIQNRPEESYFSKLDSSIKKNTAFVRKLKNFTEAQKEGIIKDIGKKRLYSFLVGKLYLNMPSFLFSAALNLTKYISEVASAIVEAKLKMTDIVSIIQVCVTLHEKYVDFGPQLLETWQKVLSLKKDEKVCKILMSLK